MRGDPKKELQDAICKLTEFNQKNSADKQNSLHKTMRLMRHFFSTLLLEKGEKQQEGLKEVRRAIAILKSHYRFIEKLQEGTPQEQKLASSVFSAIEQYNAIIDKARQKPRNLNERIDYFLLKKSGSLLPQEFSKIYFPKSISLQINFSEQIPTAGSKKIRCSLASPLLLAASQKISYLSSTLVPMAPLDHSALAHLPKQTLELFHMKAISLIEQHGLLSTLEARTALRKCHLQSQIDASDPSQCSVVCQLTPFPGQLITLSGAFEKDHSSGNYSLPKNNSFHLTLTATHSGFPYPSQYTGWAFPDLTPHFPHCLDDLPLFRQLYQRKQLASQSLQPGRTEQLNRVNRAKQLYEGKKRAAESNKESFLALHQELSLSIANAATSEGILDKDAEVMQRFFAKLKTVQHFYDYCAETYQMIHDQFIMRPFAALETSWMEKREKETPLAFLMGETRRAQQELSLQKEKASSELEKTTLNFILSLGQIVAVPAQRILLQHFSEMRFPPPMLDDFEQKIQMATFRQLKSFLDELEGSDEPPAFETGLKAKLEADIALFRAPSFASLEATVPESHYVYELEAYFNSRHYTTLN